MQKEVWRDEKVFLCFFFCSFLQSLMLKPLTRRQRLIAVLKIGHLLVVVTHQITGGNTGGFLKFVDPSGGPGDGGQILAPDGFLGDWSGLISTGTISFDYKIFDLNVANAVDRNPIVRISGASGVSADYNLEAATSTTDWENVLIPLSSEVWEVNGGSWDGLLSKCNGV